MADLAVVFHWPPSAMAEMDLGELMAWRAQAERRTQAEKR
ncbi:GpE family phage tail protein [Sphingomonas sp.]